MSDGKEERIVVENGASRGAMALAAVITFVMLLIVLAYLFGGQLYGRGEGRADVKVNVQPG